MAVFLWIISAIALTSVAANEVDKKGYEVTTVLDGNKLGVAFHDIYDDAIGGESVVALDVTTTTIYSVSLPLSQSSEVKRIAGGKPGYRDGSANEAQFQRPRGLAVDSDGYIYVADTKNTAVRMVSTAGVVTTIAGGSNRTGRNDGEGSEVTFSNDFDVTFLRSTCSLAIADRGNRLIRAVKLPHFDGRCRGATPNLPGRTFTSAELLMAVILAAIAAAVATTIATILLLSTQRLEHLQSTFCSIGNNRRQPQLGQLINLEDDDNEALTGPPPNDANQLTMPPPNDTNYLTRPPPNDANYLTRPPPNDANYLTRPPPNDANQLGDSLLRHKNRSC